MIKTPHKTTSPFGLTTPEGKKSIMRGSVTQTAGMVLRGKTRAHILNGTHETRDSQVEVVHVLSL